MTDVRNGKRWLWPVAGLGILVSYSIVAPVSYLLMSGISLMLVATLALLPRRQAGALLVACLVLWLTNLFEFSASVPAGPNNLWLWQIGLQYAGQIFVAFTLAGLIAGRQLILPAMLIQVLIQICAVSVLRDIALPAAPQTAWLDVLVPSLHGFGLALLSIYFGVAIGDWLYREVAQRELSESRSESWSVPD